MKRRGRPPHPDILTPREWEVLGLLRDGLSNPEIAERLGVTRDAVKYHVSEILSKLALASREEAAVWRPTEHPWWAAAFAALAGAASRLSPLARIAAVGLSVAALGGLALLAWAVLTTSGETKDNASSAVSNTDAPSPSATGPPTATEGGLPSPPLFLRDAPIEPVLLGEDLEFPAGVAGLFEVGCTECDGPRYGLARAYRSASGEVVYEPLLWTNPRVVGVDRPHNSLGLPVPDDSSAYWVTGVAAQSDGSEIFVTVCCDPFPDGDTIVARSTDAGETWAIWQRLPGIYAAIAIVSPGRLIVGSYPYGEQVPLTVLPDGETLSPPEAGAVPAMSNGELLWVGDKGLYRDGRLVMATGEEEENRQISIYAPAFRPSGESALAAVYQSQPMGNGNRVVNYLAEITRDWAVTRSLLSPDHFLSTDVWLDENRILTTVSRSSTSTPGRPLAGPFDGGTVPGIIDLSTASVHPIPHPFSDHYRTRRAIAVQRGPFARVVNTDSACVNVRAEPIPSADILDCAAEGVLLTDLLQFQEGGGVPWRRVRTPAGAEGWASMEFLETDPAYGHD